MHPEKIHQTLHQHVPGAACPYCFHLWKNTPFELKLTRNRQSKVGDFTSRKSIGHPRITLNRDLNPFLFLIDVTTYSTGRPGLLPQLTWSYEMSYTVKSISVTLGYSHTRNNQNVAIARFNDVFPNIPSDDNVTVQIPINLKSSDYVGVSIAVPVRISSWWNMLNNANFFYEKYNGSLGITQLNRGRPALQLQSNSSFTLKKGWSLEWNGNLNTGGQYGFMVVKPQWAMGVGVQKMMMKNKATLRAGITDIFWTNLPRGLITYDNYREKWQAKRETRVASINFTYRFGSNKVQQARRRNTASEEERRRAG